MPSEVNHIMIYLDHENVVRMYDNSIDAIVDFNYWDNLVNISRFICKCNVKDIINHNIFEERH